MNSAGKHAVVALLVISIAGCAEKKANTAPPAQAQAPALDAGKAGALYPPPLTTSSTQPENPAPAPPPVVAQTQPAPPPQPPPSNTGKTNSKHKTKPSASKPATNGSTTAAGPDTATAAAGANAAPSAAPDATTTIAANGEPAAASPIGELSTGAAGQTQTRKDTVDLITNTENGVNGIKRALSPQEEETVSQIRTFLSKAKIALGNEDLDGAFTLATKAKVLLDELNKS
jgi:type IV secretory pathway VirB10-like protein